MLLLAPAIMVINYNILAMFFFVFVIVWFVQFLVSLVVVVAAAGFAPQRATKIMSLIRFEPIFIFTISF